MTHWRRQFGETTASNSTVPGWRAAVDDRGLVSHPSASPLTSSCTSCMRRWPDGRSQAVRRWRDRRRCRTLFVGARRCGSGRARAWAFARASAPQAAAPGTEALGPPPPPALQPSVPEVTNPTYGSGSGGPLGTIRDLWHQAHDGPLDTPEGVAGRPANAGPAPQLPPGYISTNAPESSNPGRIRDPYAAPEPSGPPLPPGYHSLNGPPPPGYEPTGPAPAAATP